MTEAPAGFWSSDAASAAARVPVWAKPAEAAGFTPWSSYSAQQALDDGIDQPAPAVQDVLDPARIRAEAFAEGLSEGRRTVELEVAAERDAVARLAETLEVLHPEPPRELGLLLAETVKRLVRQVMGEVQIDEQALIERAMAAAEIVAEETAPVKMRVSPEDHERLKGARLPVELVADHHLGHGAILLETSGGWIEDGPEVRLDRLRAALDQMALPR